LEAQFAFVCIWAVGGCLLVDKLTDHRALFSEWWAKEMKFTGVPHEGTVFDYFVDSKSDGIWSPWATMVPNFDYAASGLAGTATLDLASVFVPTVETVRLQYLLRLLLHNGYHAMLVGGVGTGKTAIIKDLLCSLDPETCETQRSRLPHFPRIKLSVFPEEFHTL